MIAIFVVLAAAAATISHRYIRDLVAGSAVAAIASTLVWFICTLPFALQDGWNGWNVELPYMAKAAGICLTIAFVTALILRPVSRAIARPPRASRLS